jgi:outer membrane immunogenic protein
MNKLLSAVALSVLLASPVVAADMRVPAKAPPLAPAPVAYNWSGCYVGAGGGYGMYNQEAQFIDDGVPFGLSNDNGGRGWFGTVQVGCDYQVGSNFVIGAFADFDFGNNIKSDMAVASFSWVGEEKLRHSWAAGGRIGWLPFQQLLVFVSGGYTQAKFDQVDFILTSLIVSPTPWALAKHTYSGWFIGAGYEYGLGFLPGLFWKTEYRYADYGSDLVPVIFAPTGAATPDFIDSHKRIHTVRSELVWRFNFGGAPIAARY